MVKLYYQNGSSVRQTFRALRETYGQYNRPKEDTIRHIVKKYNGSVIDHPPPHQRRNVRKTENIKLVAESVR